MPPKLVLMGDSIQDRAYEKKDFAGHVRHLNERVEVWAKKFGVPPDFWMVWSRTLPLTKVGASVPVEDADEMGEEWAQLIRVKGDAADENESRLLVSLPSTVVHTLADKKFYGLRVYVNLSMMEKPDEIRRDIASELKADMPHLGD